MRNAASELAAIIAEWLQPGADGHTSLLAFRTKVAKAQGYESVEEHIEFAMALVAECQRDIESLAASGVETGYLLVGRKSWVNAILMTNVQWGGGATAKTKCITTPELALLKSLAALVDQQRGVFGGVELDAAVIEGFCLGVEAILDDAGSEVPNRAETILREAVRAVRDVLAKGDPELVARRLVDLVGLLVIVAEQTPKASWSTKMKNHATAIATGVASNAIFQLAAGSALPAIAAALAN